MQVASTQDFHKNYQIIRFDASKFSNLILVFAILSLFMHVVLHNYNTFKKNVDETTNYTSNYSNVLNTVKNESIVKAEENSKNQSLETHSRIKKLPPQQEVSRIQKTEKVTPVDVIQLKKTINAKKIGNITVVAMKKTNTLAEALSAAGFTNMQSHLIATSIEKKYKLSNIKNGDVVQIIKLSPDKSKTDSIKIIVAQKTEILIKGSIKQYNVLVRNLEENFKKKLDIFSNNKQVGNQIQKFKLSGADINKTIQKTNVATDVKRDIMNVMYIMRKDKTFKGGNLNIECVYEKVSSKTTNLFYMDIQSSAGKVRIYKYKDKGGITQYIKQNGVILNNNQPTKTSSTNGFKISYPIQHPVLGSGFGMRVHPILGKHRMHKGMDFRAKKGTPVHAPADGIIVEMTNSRGFGKHIRMRHNGTYTTLYGHLDKFANKSIGSKIRKGEVIGYVGKTGLASGEHLHFEVHENGRPVNPMKLIGNVTTSNQENSVKQLNKKQMYSFKVYQESIERKLREF